MQRLAFDLSDLSRYWAHRTGRDRVAEEDFSQAITPRSLQHLGKHAEGRPQGAQQPVVYLAVDLLAEAVTEQMRVRSSEYDPHPGTK